MTVVFKGFKPILQLKAAFRDGDDQMFHCLILITFLNLGISHILKFQVKVKCFYFCLRVSHESVKC